MMALARALRVVSERYLWNFSGQSQTSVDGADTGKNARHPHPGFQRFVTRAGALPLHHPDKGTLCNAAETSLFVTAMRVCSCGRPIREHAGAGISNRGRRGAQFTLPISATGASSRRTKSRAGFSDTAVRRLNSNRLSPASSSLAITRH